MMNILLADKASSWQAQHGHQTERPTRPSLIMGCLSLSQNDGARWVVCVLLTYIYVCIYIHTYIHIYMYIYMRRHTHIYTYHTYIYIYFFFGGYNYQSTARQLGMQDNCACVVHWSVNRRSRKTPHALSSGDLADHSTRPITALMAA